ncbi:MAG: DUF937 domain-containing protein [Gomphosphaeria aponina SAG 52.96 = DSM 107014]|uniref:DUF937 domain-containing protein n=1 Tax=Gomphosphaeria aponina SAG 52.96 = DSM 107014 TaxID=1521640 RepID=A0A941JSA4_9CHRO|nr:DUF937 domain-containing protein [Gomphosphaeria aponina SAG 52.96 = DSM 107014]
MGLFFDLLSSINNPEQEGSVDQLSTVMNSVQQFTDSEGVDSSTMETVFSALGGSLRPVLQQQGDAGGAGMLGNLIAQVSGNNSVALNSLCPPQMQQQMIQVITQHSGLDSGMIQKMLPMLLPAVFSLLNMGKGKPGTNMGNPLLNAFLNSDRDQDTNLGNVFKFANRFLHPPQ